MCVCWGGGGIKHVGEGHGLKHYSSLVVSGGAGLKGDSFALLGDIWQFLETFLIVTTWREGLLPTPRDRGQG